ncbi:hypothetical protein H4R18_003250 [Coemansia javaensis]|uniref:tRNA-uridine aminocarboxypropyltransferase 1 n=1 Tax=Coemansia javaensis TaxID=2761396 RepID=A0A9W8LHK1_9FUNG|nr:hypothetical protein H4R18_003250 [Coemansia javaensis]
MAAPRSYEMSELQVHPQATLDACQARASCETCGKSVKFYCYYCCTLVPGLAGKVPRIRLPFRLSVVKHAGELDGKSTALHAKVVAPEDVEIVTYSADCLGDADPRRCALLYPGPGATEAGEMDFALVDRVVVIDGTWSQAKRMVRDHAGLRSMQRVTIAPRRTRFWRYQSLGDSHLSTIEAIYFLYRDSAGSGYGGEYDALMYFYKYFYEHIQANYAAVPERQFTTRQRSGYIAYDSAVPAANPRPARRDTSVKTSYEFDDDLGLGDVFAEETA